MTTLLLNLAIVAALATPPHTQWVVANPSGNRHLAKAAVELLAKAQPRLEKITGLKLTGRATVVLCATTADFRRATPGIDHRHTLGVAYPMQKTIYLNCEEIAQRPFASLAITLRHELCHLLVGEVVRRGHERVPRWFDEGLACWSSGKLPFYDRSEFERAVAAGSLYRLSSLAETFPANPVMRGVAYEQSESFVRFLVERHGAGVVRRILVAAAAGRDFEAAVREATGADLATLERQWLDALRPRWPLLSWLFHTFSLFGTLSLFSLFAFLVYLRRRRKKYREWETEERLWGNPWGSPSPWNGRV